MKIFELAKELNISNAEILECAKTLKIEGITSHLNSIKDEDALLIKEYFNIPAKVKSEGVPKEALLDTDEILVKSNVVGELIYQNHKTGDTTVWANQNEIQPVLLKDLKDMKAGQLAFFENNWVLILGAVGKPTILPEDVYKILYAEKYYKNFIDVGNLAEVIRWSESTIRERIPKISENAKFSLIVALRDAIANNVFDSLSKIKIFEEALDVNLRE